MSATFVTTPENTVHWAPDVPPSPMALPTRAELAAVWAEKKEDRMALLGATASALLEHVHALESAVELLRAEVERLKAAAER